MKQAWPHLETDEVAFSSHPCREEYPGQVYCSTYGNSQTWHPVWIQRTELSESLLAIMKEKEQ